MRLTLLLLTLQVKINRWCASSASQLWISVRRLMPNFGSLRNSSFHHPSPVASTVSCRSFRSPQVTPSVTRRFKRSSTKPCRAHLTFTYGRTTMHIAASKLQQALRHEQTLQTLQKCIMFQQRVSGRSSVASTCTSRTPSRTCGPGVRSVAKEAHCAWWRIWTPSRHPFRLKLLVKQAPMRKMLQVARKPRRAKSIRLPGAWTVWSEIFHMSVSMKRFDSERQTNFAKKRPRFPEDQYFK
mmetsp:Transcript_32935/g.60525  ORF Transcript_32935/g.60525 Transcript_32935/m.60525 type:complete len:240 (-) Transcript_32935:9-728(-)